MQAACKAFFSLHSPGFVHFDWAKPEPLIIKFAFGRTYNSEEEEARSHLPIENDQEMRLIFGRVNLQEATISIMKKSLTFSKGPQGCNTFLAQVRTVLFSDNYQERRSLANRSGGFNSKVKFLR